MAQLMDSDSPRHICGKQVSSKAIHDRVDSVLSPCRALTPVLSGTSDVAFRPATSRH